MRAYQILFTGLTAVLLSLLSLSTLGAFTDPEIQPQNNPGDSLKNDAFEVLEQRCNSCHRKQNPFVIFSKKNMSKRVNKIYKVVYIEQRMPKAGAPRLTEQESATLKRWILQQAN